MIKQSTIDAVRNHADLTELVNEYSPVKRNKACCPIHNENSPSFSIFSGGDRYHCFGCGADGDAFTFVMAMKKLTFYEAIQFLAERYNVPVEFDQQYQGLSQEEKDLRTEALASAKWAVGRYAKTLQELPDVAESIVYLESRGYTKERREKWSLGFAPKNFKFLTSTLIEAGKHKPSVEIGLLSVKDGVTNDFFVNRIIIPIHDHNGVIVGMAGRLVPSDSAENDKRYAKYLNPKESIIYAKAKIWYGLWQAQAAIKMTKFVYVTEGYMDVQSMHDWGIENTVASCGTEIDILQAKFLKRYTDHVVLCYDGDDVGIKKAMKQIELFLSLDFKVSIVELPNKQDPDEWIRARHKKYAAFEIENATTHA